MDDADKAVDIDSLDDDDETDEEEEAVEAMEDQPSRPVSAADSCKSSYSLSSDSTITGSDYTQLTGLNSSSVYVRL